MTFDFRYELANFAGGGFCLLALNAEQEPLQFMVGEPCMQDARQNDRKGNDSDKDGGIFVKKSAARNAGSRCCRFLLPWIKHLDNQGFLSRRSRLFSGSGQPARG
ncbi:MAG TPA: hypothetical protein VFK79_11655 [Xanthobacteraceae bacterium]|nr:hypothetical protein [Xanthobacteraceae bacterium]